jgi:hypothetical protein
VQPDGAEPAPNLATRVTIALAVAAIVLAALAVFATRSRDDAHAAKEQASITSATSGSGEGRSAAGRGEDGDDELTGAGPATAAGRVTTPSGSLAGARVCAWPEHDQLQARFTAPVACAASDAQGRYELAGMRPGRWVVTASAAGWAAASHRPAPPATALVLRGGERKDGIDIALTEPGTNLRVIVRDLTGGPIEGAIVFAGSDRLDISTVSWLARPPSVGESNAEGFVELSVRPGGISVRARADGYAEGSSGGTAPGPDIEVVLAPESAIAGRVVWDGEPVANAIVTATIHQGQGRMPERAALATSDDAGRFRLSGLAPGNYRVQARVDGGYGEVSTALEIGFAEHMDDVVIELVGAGSLHARVELEGTGEPCKGGFVALRVNDSIVTDWASIGVEGDVEFPALVPATYQPRISCLTGASKERYASIVVTGTELPPVTWLVEAGSTVRGRVLDHDGGAVPGAEVMLARSGAFRISTADPDGSYEMLGVQPGTYQVSASRDALSTAPSEPLEVGPGVLTHDLELLAPARLVGRVVDRSHHGVLHAVITVTRELNGSFDWQAGSGVSDRDGGFSIELDPGRWRVTAEVDGVQTESKLVKLDTGPSPPVELMVDSRRGTIRGRVVESDGGPVADAAVVVQAAADAARGRAVLDGLRASAAFVRGRVTLTDDDGRFRMEVPAGPHVVLARRRGGGEAWKLGVEIGQDVKLVVPEESAIAGEVTAEDGTPPGRMSVRVACDELGLRREEVFVLSKGRFRIEGLPAGRYVVRAHAPEGSGRTEVTLADGEVAGDLAITLVPGAPKSGRFVDFDTGEPVPGMIAVGASTDESLRELSMRAAIVVELGDTNAMSDEDGRFTIPDVTGSEIRLGALPADFAAGVYGGTAAQVPAVEGLPDIALVKLRVGRDETPGTFGLTLAPPQAEVCTEDLAVAGVSGPAAAAGVSVGDTITAIDGKDVTGWRCYVVGHLLHAKVGHGIQLTLGRGDTVTLIAAPEPK